jgi:TatD DNase family protein
LDFWYSQAKKAEKKQQQADIFKRQLLIAKKNDLPVSIHSRGAWKECVNICSESEIEKAVFHWYSGPIDILRLALDKGYFVSFTPALEYSLQHQEVAKFAPLDKIMLETDSPVKFSAGSIKENSQPVDVLRSLKYLSEIKLISEEKLAERVFENSVKFFNLPL